MPAPPESPADGLVRAVAARLPSIATSEIPALGAAHDVDSFDPDVLAKAWWTVDHVMRASGRRGPSRARFTDGYRRAWSVFYLQAAAALAGAVPRTLNAQSLPQVLWIYHFPEYPRLIRLGDDPRVAILIKRFAPWMGHAHLLHVDDPMSLRRLLAHLRGGGVVVAMVDHAFSTTHNRAIPFLGRPCQTPMGLFELASRLSASMGLLLPQGDDRWSVVEFEAGRFDSATARAAAVLDVLSEAILAAPERWLLWPNLNHRWIAEREPAI